MGTTGRTAESTVAAVESASFVHVLARADGDALAASGVLGRALAERGTPFQVSVPRSVEERTARATDCADDEAAIAVGPVDAAVPGLDAAERPASVAACDVARELGATPDPALALAGAFAAGVEPGAGETESLLETAGERVERRPGVAVPTADLVDGLAHSTLLSAPWSGDPDAVRDRLAPLETADPGDASEFDEDDHRRVGSLVALETVGADDASTRAAHEIGRVLRPSAAPAAPFETIGGYADVLEATATTAAGTGVALALGHDVREAALEAWREHGRRAHAALAGASTGRYDGLFVVGGDGPVATVARLAAAYRSPEPAVLAIGDGEAALATADDRSVGPVLEGIAREVGADYDAGRGRGVLRFDPELEDGTIIAEVRAAL